MSCSSLTRFLSCPDWAILRRIVSICFDRSGLTSAIRDTGQKMRTRIWIWGKLGYMYIFLVLLYLAQSSIGLFAFAPPVLVLHRLPCRFPVHHLEWVYFVTSWTPYFPLYFNATRRIDLWYRTSQFWRPAGRSAEPANTTTINKGIKILVLIKFQLCLHIQLNKLSPSFYDRFHQVVPLFACISSLLPSPEFKYFFVHAAAVNTWLQWSICTFRSASFRFNRTRQGGRYCPNLGPRRVKVYTSASQIGKFKVDNSF